MKDLKKMMGKEEKGPDMKKDAKLNVLKSLRKMASDMMGSDLKTGIDGMKKVTVAADDEDGLAAGLAKAKELIGEDEEVEMEESDDMDMEDCSPEEIDAKIAKLQEMKARLQD